MSYLIQIENTVKELKTLEKLINYIKSSDINPDIRVTTVRNNFDLKVFNDPRSPEVKKTKAEIIDELKRDW